MATTIAPISASSPRVVALRRWSRFGACCLAVALVWLLILPALSNRPGLQQEIADRNAKKIDASAMFYTDLELMDDVLARLEHFHRAQPSALWQPHTGEPFPAGR